MDEAAAWYRENGNDPRVPVRFLRRRRGRPAGTSRWGAARALRRSLPYPEHYGFVVSKIAPPESVQ